VLLCLFEIARTPWCRRLHERRIAGPLDLQQVDPVEAEQLAWMAPGSAAFDLQTCPLYVEVEEEDMSLESIIDARQLRVKQDILVR
jgi:hypothetical protein